ncbi:MAG TPA: CAP domain-containing protein [Flavobacterium sp.]|jgi:uncharacterized protein YkwD
MKAKLLRTLLPLALVFTMISCSSDSEENTAQAELIQDYEYNASELELARLINDYRVSLGLNPLETINHISYKSEEHNEYMISNNVVNHDYFQERSQNIINVLGAVKVNENVAYNFNTPQSALNAWLNSSGHKHTIEGDFTHFGISVTINPETGKKYYTNIFIKK